MHAKKIINRNRLVLLMALGLLTLISGSVALYRGMGGSNDFDTYYVAGKSVLEGWNLYDGTISTPYSGSRGPFLYPPFAACVFLPLALLPLPAAAVVWNSLNILFFIWSVTFCRELFVHAGKGSLPNLRMHELFPAALIGAGIFFDNLVMTQVNLLIFFLITGALLLRVRGRPRLSGFLMAISCFFKLAPLAFFIFFAVRRDGRVLQGMLAGLLAAGILIPFILLGPEQALDQNRLWGERMLRPVWEAQQETGETHLLRPDPGTGLSPGELETVRKAELMRKTHLDAQLNPRNQALSAVLTRYFLKNRNQYAYNDWYPVWGARRYTWLPVLWGIDENNLLSILKGLGLSLTLLFAAACYRRSGSAGDKTWLADTAMTFLFMMLLTPIARTHQFTGLFFAVAWITFFAGKRKKFFIWTAAVLYTLCLFRPFQAAGAAGLLNAVLFIYFLFHDRRTRDSVLVSIREREEN